MFTTVFFTDPSLLGWRETLYLVIPFPKKWIPYPETSTSEVYISETSKSLILPTLPVEKIPLGSETGTLEVPLDDVDQVVQGILLQLPLGESPARVDYEPPTGSPS